MPAASLPDYYALLGVSPTADADAIRKAYRTQARRYHPDAAPDNPFAPAQFRALKDAYEILSVPQKRRRYDDERWLRGLSGKTIRALSPETLIRDAERLCQRLQGIGRSAVQPRALQQLLLYLVQDAHLALFVEAGDEALSGSFGETLLNSVAYLPHRYIPPVLTQLRRLQPIPEDFETQLTTLLKTRMQQHQWERRLPWLVLLITLLLCTLIALSHRS
ncbi:MAG: J domain-containing protein [Sphingobacteriales bacterium]|nr:MAG: J domain-containing protein [Sphingobacteriales bacterium]